MSAKDLRGRLLDPVMALPRRPLSNSASTDSCNILFSLRTIMSGAFKSNKRRKRLFLLITRRYKSFKSEVAKRPPSKGTNGLRSGGRIGNTVNTIHSGLLPESLKDSANLRRLDKRFSLVSDLVVSISSRSVSTSFSSLISFSRSRIASAPIRASNSSPNSSKASRYCSSVNTWQGSSVVIPGSTTTKASKYKIRSISRNVISNKRPIREGNDFKNQI